MRSYRRRESDCPCRRNFDKGLRALPARDARRLQDDGGDPNYDTVHPAEFGVRGCCCGDCDPDAYAAWYALQVAAWGTDDRTRWPS